MIAQMLQSIQDRLKVLYGPEHYYTSRYVIEELSYCGHIPEWMGDLLWPLDYNHYILDIGPGYGTLAALASRLSGLRVQTVDRMCYIPQEVRNEFNLNCRMDDIERYFSPLPNTDVVIMTEVLEHFNFHPVPTLTRIRKSMTPGGTLFLSTPDADSWGRTAIYPRLEAIPEFDPEHQTYNDPIWQDRHIWQYTEGELRWVLESAGFKIELFGKSESVGGEHFNLTARA